MTERWRKKLEGIDQVGPGQDVFDRAKRGPTLPEPQSPMHRTSTRVVTAIAAFVVFALAISLFAIPALRLGGNERFVSAGDQIQPLWPWNSVDAVQAWRDDPQPIGLTSVDHFSSPDEVAAAFGREVLGWGEVWAREEGAPQTYPCPGPGPAPYPDMSSAPPAGNELCSAVFPSGSMPPTMVPYAPTTTPPAFRTFNLTTCPPSSVCDYAPPGPPDVKVVVFQPLGDAGPWAVLEARSELMSISLEPGAELHDGSTVYASGAVPGQLHAVLGAHNFPSECAEIGATTGFEATDEQAGNDQLGGGISFPYLRGQLDLSLSPQAPSCQRQPAYAFIIVSQEKVSFKDVLNGLPPAAGVVAFSAVPVTLSFPSTEEATTSPPTSAPGEPGWTTYTDPLGWTIDVPTSWIAEPIDGSDASTTYAGAVFASAPVDHQPGGPTTIGVLPGEVALLLYHSSCETCQGPGPRAPSDDSTLPLSISSMDPVDGGSLLAFQADGESFTLSIRDGHDAPTPEQETIFQRMISSIHFQPWQGCETRNGWTSVCGLSGQTSQAKEAGIAWMALSTDLHASGMWVGVYVYGAGNGTVLGPVESCGEGESDTAELTPQTVWVALDCPDGSVQRWTKDGQPASTNTAPFDTPLEVHPAIKAWDGTLLTSRAVPVPNG